MSFSMNKRQVVESERFKYQDACSLYSEGHVIAEEFADVLEALEEHLTDVEVAATGCPSCFVSDADHAVWYVAQNPDNATERLAFKYDVDDDAELSRVGLGHLIAGLARQHGLTVEWDGTAMSAVVAEVEA